MKVALKTWNKSRVGNVILFAYLTLLFGIPSIVIVTSLASGDTEFSDWFYLLSPLFAAIFAWGLYITASSKHQPCMRAVTGEMSFRELRKSVEAEEYAEPLKFAQYYDEDRDAFYKSAYRMFLSKSWILLGQDMSNPLCIPKNKVAKIELEKYVLEDLEPDHPARLGFFLSIELTDGKRYVSGNFTPDMHDEVESFMRKQFPEASFQGFSSSFLL